MLEHIAAVRGNGGRWFTTPKTIGGHVEALARAEGAFG